MSAIAEGGLRTGEVIQHCFICVPQTPLVSEDAGIEPMTVATLALTARRSNHLARSHSQLGFD